MRAALITTDYIVECVGFSEIGCKGTKKSEK